MRKLNLAGLSYDRDGVLNALSRTNACQVREHEDSGDRTPFTGDVEELSARLLSLENALEILVASAENFAKENKLKEKPVKDGFSVTYEEFSAAAEKAGFAEELVGKVNGLVDKKSECAAEQSKLTRALGAIKPYQLARAFDSYADTLHTKTRLGIIAPTSWDSLKGALDEMPLAAYEAERDGETVLLAVTAHKSVFSEVENLLTAHNFAQCPYSGEASGSQMYSDISEKIDECVERRKKLEEEIYSLTPSIRDLKIYCDYLGFELEKAQTSGGLQSTEHTFFLEAFVPADDEEKVKSALEKTGYVLWYEFSDPAADEEIPTLLKNNAVISNFEAITNMYSPPNAREFDPNTVMAFFYSLFLGFIMGDVGYGILMFIGGGVLWFKSRKGTGIKSLAGVFAISGIFTIFWGFLFNSLFGVAVLPYTVMPDARDGTYSFMGTITVPAVLVIAMLIGVAHLFAGYLCKAWQEWRCGRIWDGIFDGLTWAIFSVGAALAIAGLVEDFHLPSTVTLAGGILAGIGLVVAAFTAGRKEKIIGKFTKGFGSVYGIINYVSDILSYARLYGLMLSGAIIAQIIAEYAIVGNAEVVGFLQSGNVMLIVLGVVLLVVGHLFNLAIGLLGAYIHVARLQYVEFYGRFYAGEGELFTPLGSKHRHIYLEEKKL